MNKRAPFIRYQSSLYHGPLHRSRIIKILRWWLLGLTTLVVMPAHAGMWQFDFHGDPLGYSVILSEGKNYGFQLCATAAVVKVVNPWPGAEIPVAISWVRKGTDVAYQPWAGVTPSLPLKSAMVGPFPDGRYCGPVHVVKHADFPQPDIWQMRAKIVNTSIGFLPARWDVKIKKHVLKPGIPPAQSANKAPPHPGLPPGGGGATDSQQQTLPPAPAGSSGFGTKVPKEAARKPLQPGGGTTLRAAPVPPTIGARSALTPPNPIAMPNARTMPSKLPGRSQPGTGVPAAGSPDTAPQVAKPAQPPDPAPQVAKPAQQPDAAPQVVEPAQTREVVRQVQPAVTREVITPATPAVQAAPMAVPQSTRDAPQTEAQQPARSAPGRLALPPR